MKTLRLLIIAVVAAAGLVSCKSKEEEWAQKAIDRYVIFVDSVNKANHNKRLERWDFIEQEYMRKRKDAESALGVLKGKDLEEEQKRVQESNDIFSGVQGSVPAP